MIIDEWPEWPNCSTPDCQYKVCTWVSDKFCFKCMEKQIGKAEMICIYNATHDHKWEEAK